MIKKIAILFLIIASLSGSAFANEDPPGPGVFQFFFGGDTPFKQIGITFAMRYKTNAALEPNEPWHPYDKLHPAKLYPGFTLEFYINSENGRESDSKLKTTIKHSDKKSKSMVEICSFEGQVGYVEYTIPAYNTGYNFVRIYAKGGEGKTQDQVAGVVYYVESTPIVTSQNIVSYSESTNSLPINNDIGTVIVRLYDDKGLTQLSDCQAEIALYIDGKRFPERYEEFLKVNRKHTFDNVPTGLLQLRLRAKQSNWTIALSKEDTEKLNQQKDKLNKDFKYQPELLKEQLAKLVADFKWELRKNSKLIITLVKEGACSR